MNPRGTAVFVALSFVVGSFAALLPASSGDQGGTPSPQASPFLRWEDNFDARNPADPYDMERIYTAYDDYDSSSATDSGDRVMLSNDTFHSAPRSLLVRAVSPDFPSLPNFPRALATSPYLRDWETAKGYYLNLTFRLNSTTNLRLVVMKTVDVYLVVAGANALLNTTGTNLWSFSQITGTAELVAANLAVDTWHTIEICVSCVGGSFAKSGPSYTLTLDSTPGTYARFSNDVEPRSLSWGDLGNADINTGAVVTNTNGTGFWDDLVLDYWPVVSGPEANAGPDQAAPEGQAVEFSGDGRGSVAPAYYDNTSGGFDLPITTTSAGVWVTRHDEGANYVGLLTVTNGTGRAVYSPADGLSPRSTNRDGPYQKYVNAVRWATQDRAPDQTNVLLLWGQREIIAYHGGAWNQYRALLSEGYNVTLVRTLPANLSSYHAVVLGSYGWGYAGIGQQAHPAPNEEYCTSLNGQSDCPEGVDLTAQEGARIAVFVGAGGGLVASAEVDHGTGLNVIPLGVTFATTPTGQWFAPFQPGQGSHPILEKWGGTRRPIVSYRWDFCDGGVAYGQTVSHAFGRAGLCTVTLTVTDDANPAQQATDTTQVTVSNVPPVVTVYASPNPVSEGQNVTFNGSFYDPSWNDTHTVLWEFGDGWSQPGTYSPGPGYGNVFHTVDPVVHAYGRQDSYLACLTVTDDFNDADTACVTISVTNVAPAVTAQANATVVNEGSPFTVWGSFDDPSWNDTFPVVRWDFGYVDTMRGLGPTVDASWSPPPGYRNTHHDVTPMPWIYGDNGNYTFTLTVQDEFGGTDSDSLTVYVRNVRPTLINITVILHQNAPRTHGYWKHQCTVGTPTQDHPGIRQEWIDAIRTQSTVFTDVYTKAQVCSYLDPPKPQTPLKKAKMQLMALWLNVVSGLLWGDSPLHHPGAPGDDTVMEFIQHAELLILTAPNDPNMNWVNTIATDINEDADGGADWQYIDPVVGEYIAHAFDPGTDDLFFVWSTGRTGDPHVVHEAVNSGDPDYEPVSNEVRTPEGTYPFSATDRLVIGYPPGSGTLSPKLLCLMDDDGDASVDANSNCEEAGVSPLGLPGPGPALRADVPASMARGGAAASLDPGPRPMSANETVDWSFSFTIAYRQISGGFTVADVVATFLSYEGMVTPSIVGGTFG